MLRRQAKAELRKRRRALRNSMPEGACGARSEKIVQRIVESAPFARSTALALFWPMLERKEVDVRPLDRVARDRGMRVAYPYLDDDAVMTLLVCEPSLLEERGHGFAEPPPNAPEIEVDEGLLVIVPALAVDPTGQRIGYGRGLYDRLLERIAPPAFALAVVYDFELAAELPVTEGDVTVDMVVTDARTFLSERPRP